MLLPNSEARISQQFTVSSTEKEPAVAQVDNQVAGVTHTYEFYAENNVNVSSESEWGKQAKRLAKESRSTSTNACIYPAGYYASKTVGSRGLDGKAILPDSPPDARLTEMPIDYVFVLMLENRSFDSYFGHFPAYLKDVLKKTAQDDPRVRSFLDDLSPDGVDVPGTPYHLLSAANKAIADKDFTLNANTRRNAPYNLNATDLEKSDHVKHYWKHHSLFSRFLVPTRRVGMQWQRAAL
jgi:hypothetical protein